MTGMPGAQQGGRTGGSQGPGMQGGAPGQGGFQRPPLPAGVTEEQWNAIRQKRQNNEPLTAADSQIMARVRAAREAQGGGQGGPQGQPGAAPGGAPGAPAAGAQDGGSALPPGVSREQLMAIFQKQRSGGTLTGSEQAIMAQMRQRFGGSGGGDNGSQRRRQFGANSNFQYGGSYIVFVLRNGQPTPVRVRTGFTDMDFSEVVTGLTDKDTVLLLPSASLVAQQDEMKSRMSRMGGGVPGMTTNQPRPGGGGPGRDH
jgi:hypothetical protein